MALPEPARSTGDTSLPSLPEDLLHMIFEEVSDQRQEEVEEIGRPRVEEILVNKRIFAIAQRSCFSRLTISRPQLDSRLSGLLRCEARCQALRRLEIPFNRDIALLTESVLARIPFLTHLWISVPHSDRAPAHSTLVRLLQALPRLQYLTLNLAEPDIQSSEFARFVASCRTISSPSLRSRTILVNGQHGLTDTFHKGRTGRHFAAIEDYNLDWNKVQFFKYSNESVSRSRSSWPHEFLRSLAAAVEGDENRPATQIPLIRLAVPLPYNNNPWWMTIASELNNFTIFLSLLSSIQTIEQLELTSVRDIPTIELGARILSVKVLKLSGSCSFRTEANFDALRRLLSACPSLLGLHLKGASFFHSLTTSAEELSRIEHGHRSFRYPELLTLLVFLRKTKVRVFSYQIAADSSEVAWTTSEASREARWTRSSEKDDFDVDCWTL
ncbi:hypothetical protein JCM16303_001057 [Sporobolomyces ruberrimus]